jgi:hypothetical protein
MLRKTIVAIAATAAIAVAALPTSASAHKFHRYGWGAFGVGVGLGLVGTGLYVNSCNTIWETRYSPRRGIYYQVPVTYC